jgi:hypothetical protein
MRKCEASLTSREKNAGFGGARWPQLPKPSRNTAGLWLITLCLVCAPMSYGKQAQGGTTSSNTGQAATSLVPRLVNFSGVLNDASGKPLTGTITLTLSLYAEQEGGFPLWVETQTVQLDNQGHYSLLLGATQPDGLPLDLFTTGEAQWLGIQPQLPAAAEQPRVLLVGMPYALKASDADTLGGLPASAFVQAGAVVTAASGSAGAQSSNVTTAQTGNQDSGSPLSISGSGITDFLPIWANSTTLGDSVLFQSGTGNSAKVGLNTTTPASLLDVNGAGTVRGTLTLPATGTASASVGENSQPASLQASAFSSTTNAAVNQTFNLQAEPTANDTASPSGKLNLLFASGTGAPAETGLSIANNGKITFASGQAFPGTGTLTGVTTASGSGLTGGGNSGTLTLGLQKTCATNQVLQWNGTSWACASVGTGTLAGVTAGTDLTGGGTSGTVTLNLDTTKVPQLSAANSFAASQTIAGNLTLTGSGNGITFADGSKQSTAGAGTVTSVGSGAGLTGGPITGNGSLSVATGGVTNTMLQHSSLTLSPGTDMTGGGLVSLGNSATLNVDTTKVVTTVNPGTDLTGGGTGGTVTLNLDTTRVPQLAASNAFTGNQSVTGNLTATGVVTGSSFSGNGSGLTGVGTISGVTAGTDLSGGGTSGNVTLGLNTGALNGAYAQLAAPNSFTGNQSVTGNVTATGTVTGTSFSGSGSGLTNLNAADLGNVPAADFPALFANNAFTGVNSFESNTNFVGNFETATIGNMNCASGSVGISFQGNNCTQYALLDYNGSTILNRETGQNMSFREGNGPDQMTVVAGGGVEIVGTPTYVNPLWDPTTLFVQNNSNGSGPYPQTIFVAMDPNYNNDSYCYIDINADLWCSGSTYSPVSLDDGRRVALAAVESPENWFEEYGGGTLSDGVASVTLEPAFAQTVNTAVEYRVFLTPKGDCEGLYVTNETPAGFEVHELRGGRSSVTFDYKIVAKRKGYENVRLADKTAMVNQLKAHAAKNSVAKKP